MLALTEEISEGPESAYLERVSQDPRMRLLPCVPAPFNYSWVCNRAAATSGTELLCFLNDDVDVIGPDWLGGDGRARARGRVGAVGAKLYYPDGRIQHAGVGLGLAGVAAPLHRGLQGDAEGYLGRARLAQDLSCVTAACLLVRRSVFEAVGGFDESLAVAFNDVDLCLRIREAGWRVVWTPLRRAPPSRVRFGRPARLGRPPRPVRRGDRRFPDPLGLTARPRSALQPEPLAGAAAGSLAFPPRVAYPCPRKTAAE